MITGWEISLGLYPGVLFGFRSYIDHGIENHVLYIPFIDVCLSIQKEVNEEE
tara:strand:- start:368 stop:523 length:156 start_codon:yes stop_codon:yes gene_type:complete